MPGRGGERDGGVLVRRLRPDVLAPRAVRFGPGSVAGLCVGAPITVTSVMAPRTPPPAPPPHPLSPEAWEQVVQSVMTRHEMSRQDALKLLDQFGY